MISNCKRRRLKKIEPIAPQDVVNLYNMTGVTPMAGIQDYTEGIYQGDPFTDYAIAQKNQHNYLHYCPVKAKINVLTRITY